MASAKTGAVEMYLILLHAGLSVGYGIVSSRSSYSMQLFSMRSIAGPESTPWVAQA